MTIAVDLGRKATKQTKMIIYRHWVIMAYSEKMSDIIVLEKCEVDSTKKASIAFALNKGDNSVKSLQITSTFEIDLYL